MALLLAESVISSRRDSTVRPRHDTAPVVTSYVSPPSLVSLRHARFAVRLIKRLNTKDSNEGNPILIYNFGPHYGRWQRRTYSGGYNRLVKRKFELLHVYILFFTPMQSSCEVYAETTSLS